MGETNQQFSITWLDSGREPRVAPNPDYPDGKDLDMIAPGERSCFTPLPYPAKRIGTYVIECKICGVRVGCTTAGRPDDPRSIKVPCKPMVTA